MEEIMAEEKREEKDCKKVTISMVEGEYQHRFKMMEREFGLDFAEEEPRVEQEMKVIAPIGGRTSKSSGGKNSLWRRRNCVFSLHQDPVKGLPKTSRKGGQKHRDQ